MGKTGLCEELRFELGPEGEKELPWGRHLGTGYCRDKSFEEEQRGLQCGWSTMGVGRGTGGEIGESRGHLHRALCAVQRSFIVSHILIEATRRF